MKAYGEPRESKPENAPNSAVTVAFDKAKAYDDMRDNIIGLRNSAWAACQRDEFASSSALHYAMNALLDNDEEVLLILRYPIV